MADEIPLDLQHFILERVLAMNAILIKTCQPPLVF